MTSSPTLLFDGVCNLCHAGVQFIIKHEAKDSTLQFASLQSDAGRALLAEHGLSEAYFDSLVYLKDGRTYTHSDGAVQIAKHLKAPYRWLGAAKIIPTRLRNALYDFVGRHRYRWFGQKAECWLPSPELKARFL